MMSTQEDPLAPRAEDRNENENEKQPQGGQILMTTRIETEIEIESHVDARHGSHTDLERQQLGW